MTKKLENAPAAILLIAGVTVFCAKLAVAQEPWQWRPVALSTVDAATSWNHGYAYLFRGPEYSRSGIKKGKVDKDHNAHAQRKGRYVEENESKCPERSQRLYLKG